ncbi:MAG: amidohydrolase family protein [Candidatus Amulumruptor caecigallinarius]|nr:amidohydrolase family protein [Candidatus Amulumruptor caecigallinarius]MCM1397161.1 amidohydrolase family protein [Candidatus Amulumruptor caecigallinarius]MCM1453150.1 amidohydrolase family protein [bacterium]
MTASQPATLLTNAVIVNRGRSFRGSLLVAGDEIAAVYTEDDPLPKADTVTDLGGAWLLPGAIDTHVHFREPGLTDKGSIATESRAAVAGGVTSYIDMPNTVPQTVTQSAWRDKMAIAANSSAANYAFFIGASATNTDALLRMDYTRVAGIKLFLGSTTGDMMVDNDAVARRLLRNAPCEIVVHAESERIIRENLARLNPKGLDDLPVESHSEIRDIRACVESSARIVEMAREEDALLHLAHVSTAAELSLLTSGDCQGKRITAETCPHYLTFTTADYHRAGTRIKCNPAIKGALDLQALRRGVTDGLIDTVATDHAPHLAADKHGGALRAKSGMPMVQFSVVKMMDLFAPEIVATKMAHNPARIFGIERRGFLDPGFKADLTVVSALPAPRTISDSEVLSKCGWTPLAGFQTSHRIELTMVNGHVAYSAAGGVAALSAAEALRFSPVRR